MLRKPFIDERIYIFIYIWYRKPNQAKPGQANAGIYCEWVHVDSDGWCVCSMLAGKITANGSHQIFRGYFLLFASFLVYFTVTGVHLIPLPDYWLPTHTHTHINRESSIELQFPPHHILIPMKILFHFQFRCDIFSHFNSLRPYIPEYGAWCMYCVRNRMLTFVSDLSLNFQYTPAGRMLNIYVRIYVRIYCAKKRKKKL